MKAWKSVKPRHLSRGLWLAVVAVMILSFGAMGCRSTKSSGGGDSCTSGCTGH